MATGRTMNKHVKRLIIALAIILVIAIIALSLVFTLINNMRFMTYTKSKLKGYAADYRAENVNFIAHRGLSGEAYQNTAEAFRLAAADETLWGIETDVWATSDGGFVCMHDRDALKDVDNVKNITLEQALKTPLKNSQENYAPSVEEYLSICAEGGKVAVVEIKDEDMTHEDIDILLQKIHDSGAQVRIISFHYEKLDYIRDKDGEVKLQWLVYLALSKTKKLKTAISRNIDLSCMYQTLAKSVVKMFHDAGREVGVWTVNSARDAMLMVTELGVDYVTTDIRMPKEIDSYIKGL